MTFFSTHYIAHHLSISERRCKGRGIKNETPAKFAEAAKNLYFFTILRILRGETSVERAVFELASYGCLFHITRNIFSIECFPNTFDSHNNCSGSFNNSPLSSRAFTNSSTILSKISHMTGVMSYVCLLMAQFLASSYFLIYSINHPMNFVSLFFYTSLFLFLYKPIGVAACINFYDKTA